MGIFYTGIYGGIYKSHPNNVIYLIEKYRLSSKDIKYIISAIDEDKKTKI